MDLKDEKGLRDELDRALLQELGEDVSSILLDHVLNPRNVGLMQDPDGEATLTGICEDTVRIQLRLQGDRIQEIKFMTNGCAATVACGSVVTELAEGRTLQEALEINEGQISHALGGLPIEHTHCAALAANALKTAVQDAFSKGALRRKRKDRGGSLCPSMSIDVRSVEGSRRS